MSEFQLDKIQHNEIVLFRQRYLKHKSFNVGIYIDNSNLTEYVKIFKNIKDIQLYSLNNLFKDKDKIINLSRDLKSKKDLAVAVKSMHLLITDNEDLINVAGTVKQKTFAISNQYKFPHYTETTFYDNNNIPKAFVNIKQDLQQYRLNSREKYLLSLLAQIKKDENRDLYNSLKIQSTIINDLFELTAKSDYLKSYIYNKERLCQFPQEKPESLALIATVLGLFTTQKEEVLDMWENDILPYLKESHLLYNYACFQLSLGNFKEFRKYYDRRLYRHNEQKWFAKYNLPLWVGERNVKDKTLLILSEYGIGDNFIFLQHIEKLNKIFKKVVLAAKKPIYQLCKDSFKNIEVLKDEEINSEMKLDYITTVMTIPVELNIFPPKYQKRKWLYANKTKVKNFKKFFNKDKFNIGIFWESQKNKYSRETDLETLMPIAYLDKVQLYSLHIEKEDYELNYIDPNINIINIGKYFNDFSDTAAAIENCDLIISTDSSVLNLAGAMGKKTFGLFNKYAEWRWYKIDEEDTGWYKTVKPFHAKEHNNFTPEIEKMCKEIKNLVEQKFKT